MLGSFPNRIMVAVRKMPSAMILNTQKGPVPVDSVTLEMDLLAEAVYLR